MPPTDLNMSEFWMFARMTHAKKSQEKGEIWKFFTSYIYPQMHSLGSVGPTASHENQNRKSIARFYYSILANCGRLFFFFDDSDTRLRNGGALLPSFPMQPPKPRCKRLTCATVQRLKRRRETASSEESLGLLKLPCSAACKFASLSKKCDSRQNIGVSVS